MSLQVPTAPQRCWATVRRERAELIPEGKPVTGTVTHLRFRVGTSLGGTGDGSPQRRCRRLIRDGSSLSLAAASAGFADQSHMTRIFVRHLGFTPGAWKRAVARTGPQ
jgi:hypothetical protein